MFPSFEQPHQSTTKRNRMKRITVSRSHSLSRWPGKGILALFVALAVSSASAGVTNDFVGGLGQRTDIVDAYPGTNGDGWADAWTFGPGSSPTGVLVDAVVTNTAP